MEIESIVAISLAGITGLTAVLTVAYTQYTKSFGDKQYTKVTLTSKIYNPEKGNIVAEKCLVYNMSNMENFETETLKFKNGKQTIEQTSKKKIADPQIAVENDESKKPSEATHLLEEDKSEIDKSKLKIDLNALIEDNEQAQNISVSELQAVLNNNANGDREISEARQYTFFHTANIWLASVKADYDFFKSYFGNDANELQNETFSEMSGETLDSIV